MGRPFWKGGSRAGESPFLSAQVCLSSSAYSKKNCFGFPVGRLRAYDANRAQSVAARTGEIKFAILTDGLVRQS